MIMAAGFAIAATGAFAETGVSTYQIDNVSNVYGRAGVPTVKVTGAVASQAGNVADAGRGAARGDSKLAVRSGDNTIEFGRS